MGRIARSWELTKQSYRVLMKDKELMLLPVLSGLVMLVICGTFVAGFLLAGEEIEQINKTQGVVVGLLLYIVSYTAAFFFQAALIAGALERMGGGDPTVGSALRAASSRFGAILLWGVIAGTVGAILRTVQERSEVSGRILTGLIGFAWSLATYFMVPVLVMENEPIGASFKRSAELFKKTWGETLAGGAGIGILSFVVMLPIIAISVFLGTNVHPWVGIGVGVPAIALGMVFFSALRGVYNAALYRYATTGESPDGFDDELIANAFDRRRRR